MTYYPMTLSEHRDDHNAYIPSQTKIEEECLKIQKTWDITERKKRLVISNPCVDITRTDLSWKRRRLKNEII